VYLRLTVLRNAEDAGQRLRTAGTAFTARMRGAACMVAAGTGERLVVG
jgi:hypothetical protein